MCLAVHKAEHTLKCKQPEGEDDNRLCVAMKTSLRDIFAPKAETDLRRPKPCLDFVVLFTDIIKMQDKEEHGDHGNALNISSRQAFLSLKTNLRRRKNMVSTVAL